MPSYSADVGSWERGRVVEFDAEDDDAALRHALTLPDWQSEELVQIRRVGHGLIWDYTHGTAASSEAE